MFAINSSGNSGSDNDSDIAKKNNLVNGLLNHYGFHYHMIVLGTKQKVHFSTSNHKFNSSRRK